MQALVEAYYKAGSLPDITGQCDFVEDQLQQHGDYSILQKVFQ